MSVNLKGKERAVDGGNDDDIELRTNIVRAFIGQVEIWMDPSYDLWYVRSCFDIRSSKLIRSSFAPEAEKTCEGLLESALRIDSDNSEVLQALASVRMSQQRPEEAKQCLEKAWSSWKDLDIGDQHPFPTRFPLSYSMLQTTQKYRPFRLDFHLLNFS